MGAPSSFQRLMSAVLAELQWESAIAYLDDVIVHSKTWEEHLNKLRIVCQRFKDHNLTLNPEKCQFGHREVQFLGLCISGDGSRPNPEKIAAIRELPSPTTLKDLRGVLGSLSYFRRFIPNFADTAKPLYRLLEKHNTGNKHFQWSPQCEQAYQKLKEQLCQAPVLAFPNFDKPFILTTDASLVGIGGVLTQKTVEKERPIAFFSRTLNKAEQNYPTHERELLAIVSAIKHFRLSARKISC